MAEAGVFFPRQYFFNAVVAAVGVRVPSAAIRFVFFFVADAGVFRAFLPFFLRCFLAADPSSSPSSGDAALSVSFRCCPFFAFATGADIACSEDTLI